MGGAIIEDNGFNNITSITYDSSVPKLEIERAWMDVYGASAQSVNLSDSFVQAQKDGDNIKLTKISGAQTTVGPFSGGGGGGGTTSTSNYPTSAMTSNALPSPLVAVGSSEYNLFTDKLFGSDNLGNIGDYVLNGTTYDIYAWGYDASDGNVIVSAYDTTHTRFVKITQTGTLVTGLGGNTANTGKYILNTQPTYTTLADLIAGYNGATHYSGTATQTFNKHALFDLAVNNSPAYHAFDEDDTSEWVSHSNRYDSATGDYIGSSKLATITDNGEYVKVDLGSAITAETLNLKSIAEYKEPRINMTGYNQCGYEVTASSENSATSPVYLAFNNLTTPDTDKWISASNVYDATNGNYLPGGSQLSASSPIDSDGVVIPLGEYLMITFPDKRKLIGYTLSIQASGTAGTPKQFILYARETSTSTWVNLDSQSLTTALGSYVSGDVNTGGTRFNLSNPTTTAYQSFALVITHNFPAHLVHLNEFKLHCQPSEIEEFKLYGSVNDVAWTEIHAQTSANITSTATDFTITNPGSYQHYGLVITKNGGYHNVSLGEMKLQVTDTVDLSNYYTKPQVNSLLPKGVLAEGSFTYVKNNSNSFAIAQANFFAASSNVGWNSSNVILQTRHFGDPTIWAYAPACRQLHYEFTFTSPILDDAGQETSDYKVMLTRRDVSLSYLDTIYELAVHEKTPDYFKVRIELQVDTSTYHIETHGFDFVVF